MSLFCLHSVACSLSLKSVSLLLLFKHDLLETSRLCRTTIFPLICCPFAVLHTPFGSFRSALCVVMWCPESQHSTKFDNSKKVFSRNALLWWWWGRQRIGVSVFNFSFPVLLARTFGCLENSIPGCPPNVNDSIETKI